VNGNPMRVGLALALGAFAGAADLAVLLIVLANLDSGQPVFNEISLLRIFWNSVAFCFFTVPVSWVFGFPLYCLMRRVNLLKVWVCSLLGSIVAVLPLVPWNVDWIALLWLGLSGAAGGTVVLLLRPTSVNHCHPPT
jgi:ABC-type spermidine/putrescine transport system permease subunit II